MSIDIPEVVFNMRGTDGGTEHEVRGTAYGPHLAIVRFTESPGAGWCVAHVATRQAMFVARDHEHCVLVARGLVRELGEDLAALDRAKHWDRCLAAVRGAVPGLYFVEGDRVLKDPPLRKAAN